MVTFTSEQLWECLSTVSDPEIPAVSVVDLGIVRSLTWHDDECEVIITPTYSGCPATQVIAESIEQALRSLGIEKIVIRNQLSPAWTTDWMSAAGREKLKAFGLSTFAFKWKNPEVYFKPLWQHPLSAKAMHWITNWLQHFAAGLHAKRLS